MWRDPRGENLLPPANSHVSEPSWKWVLSPQSTGPSPMREPKPDLPAKPFLDSWPSETMLDNKCVYDLKPLNWANWLCSRRLKTQGCYRKARVINYVKCCKELHVKQKGGSQIRNGSVCQGRWEQRESRHFSWEAPLRREGAEKWGSNLAVGQEDSLSSKTLEDEEGLGCRANGDGWLVTGGKQRRRCKGRQHFMSG